MHSGLELLGALHNEDIDWIFDTGNEEQIITNTQVITEGKRPDALFFVLEGLVGVFIPSLGNNPLAKLGPGEIVGDISFLKNEGAAATVRAIENSLILSLPIAVLNRKLDEDEAFAARFYRSLALINVNRLKASLKEIGRIWDETSEVAQTIDQQWGKFSQRLDGFKSLLVQADKEGLSHGGVVPEELEQQIIKAFGEFVLLLNDTIGDEAELSSLAKNEIGALVQREMLPYILMSELGERFYAKPRGYAGDFMTIEIMYQNQATGLGRLGPILDRAFRREPANIAVMNRRGLLKEEILAVVEKNGGAPSRVTSMAAGPAAELFDVYAELADPQRLKSTCIDIDLQALAFVGDKRDKLRLGKLMELHNGNLVYLALGRQSLDLKPQDLIYSIGLIDYFSDKFVNMLLNYVYAHLKPGGKVILGNFHPRNSSKALMDHLIDWKLIHRDEADMHRLFENSDFARGCTRIRFEGQGVNLFAECIRPPLD